MAVVVPVFEREGVVLRALESVAGQTFQDWELIVVDDGSRDGTAERVRAWIHERGLAIDEKARLLVLPENRGVSAARNLGVAASRGSWLAFLDSDDEWLPDRLGKQIPLTHDFRWVHGEEIWIRNGVRVNAMKKHAKSGGRIFKRCVDLCCVSPSAVLIEKNLFLEKHGFREDFPVCEDFELWLRLSSEHEIGWVGEPILRKFGGHPDQLSHRYKAMDYFRVKALSALMDHPALVPDERKHLIDSLLRRCEILLKGFRKHANLEHYEEVEAWARKARTASQIDHSQAERRPRSEANLIL